MSFPARVWRPVMRWLHGVRARLVATYLLAAIVLAVAGVALFTLALNRGLRANVDAGLHTRADAIVAELRAGNVQEGDQPPTIRAPREGASDLLAVTAVYAPGGRLISAQPSPLPASPLRRAEAPPASSGSALRTTQYAGESFRILTQPVALRDGTWLVVVGQSLGATDDASAQVRQALLIAVPILLVAVGIGAWLLSGAALRPVERMRVDAQELGEHDPSGRITEPATADSLNQLARTFNALLDRLHNSLARQRTLVADAGHELRTPLAVLQTELETAVRPTRSRADLVDSVNHARGEVARLAALAEDLLLLAQADGGQPIVRRQLADVSELLELAAGAYQERAAQHSVTLRAEHPGALIAELDPVALRRVLDNLLTNALRHTPSGGTICVGAKLERATAQPDAGAVLALWVSDTGPGFPPEFLPHSFDRFARADQGRSRTSAGSGLGLAIVQTLVHAHDGTVVAENRAAGGAQITVRLPVEYEDPAQG